MRIAFVTWGRRELGGAERYIGEIMPELSRLGHDIALWSEMDQPHNRERIPLPEGAAEWCADELGHERALAELRAWKPDLLFVHITSRPEIEAAMQEMAPAVLYSHGYFGTCITGSKTLKHPSPVPCGRRFGAKCLVHYYPDRCGGLSPFTMLREYRRNVGRRDRLGSYRAVVTNSTHMRNEYLNTGCDPDHVFTIHYPVAPPTPNGPEVFPVCDRVRGSEGWNLLFAGRMDHLKGGRTLLEALPSALEALKKPLHVTFAGDGPDRSEWERLALEVESQAGGMLSIEFVGWKSGADLEAVWQEADLLLVPSLWPEPFGLVGPEAGGRGIPAVAFALGGIPDWLRDGVNGYLAPSDPPTAKGFADAIVRCLSDPTLYATLRQGAVREAARFSMDAHLAALTRVFEDAALNPGLEH
jgi:glycosyltransferase involved in cell wall biosynthesis